ncbi:MAG: hypothetical protein CMH34_09845 [Microbacterium sp.]|nr:hypothetical protein [Microbacterium sp.]|tara:strand:+ start:182 stop:511 length:330 start_codon:yes stop_codon:yes gene_type:complete
MSDTELFEMIPGSADLRCLPKPVIEMRDVAKALAKRDREARATLVKRRRRAGLTQSDVDRVFGMPDGWTREIESYDSDPTLSDLRRYEAIVTMAEYAETPNRGFGGGDS